MGGGGGGGDERLRAAVVDTTRLGYCVIDADFTIVYANPMLAELVGTTPEALVGANGLELISEEDRQLAATAVAERLDSDGTFDDLGVPIPLRVRRADGSTVILELGALNQLDNPDLQGVIVRARPMFGREHLDEALHFLASGAPANLVLSRLLPAVEGIIEDGRALLAIGAPPAEWSVPAEVSPEMALLFGDERERPQIWEDAHASGELEVAFVEELEPTLAAAARAEGFAACWTLAIAPGEVEGCVVVWRRARRRPLVSVSVEMRRIADVVRLALERDEALRTLEMAARRDGLTGLANRATFYDLLHAIVSDPPGNAKVAVLYVDLDGFKPVNDLHGHAAGDAVLQLAAQRILSVVREGDTVARLGGDEFAVVCPQVEDASEVEAIAERLVRVFDDPIELDSARVQVGASAGVAVHHPGAGDDADRLLAAADAGLYEAKRSGRGRWVHQRR
ncbi:MAG: GGDEF domain-containing protein [Acidimicrobiia bacterium]|nr:GGDEF domain-containing protein [Acidimicrobiia bacterium]